MKTLSREIISFHRELFVESGFTGRFIFGPLFVFCESMLILFLLVGVYCMLHAVASTYNDGSHKNHYVAEKTARSFVASMGISDATVICGYEASGGMVRCTVTAMQPNKLFIMPIICPEVLSFERECRIDERYYQFVSSTSK